MTVLLRDTASRIFYVHPGIKLPGTDADPDAAPCRRIFYRVVQNIEKGFRRPFRIMPRRDAAAALHRQIEILCFRLCPYAA